MTSIKQRLANVGPSTRPVKVLIGADLQLLDEYTDVQAKLATMDRPADSLAGHGPKADLVDRLAAIEERLAEFTFEFRLKGLDDKRWERLVAAHPPRRTDDGKVDERDRVGWNMDTFPAALVRATVVDPMLDDEDWLTLLGDDTREGKLPGAELDKLSGAAFRLSRIQVDAPFWSAASSSRPDSGTA